MAVVDDGNEDQEINVEDDHSSENNDVQEEERLEEQEGSPGQSFC